MSEHQIQQILKRLDAQDKASEERLNAQYEVYRSLQAANRQHQQNLADFKRELEPLLDAFKNVEGFGKITIAS